MKHSLSSNQQARYKCPELSGYRLYSSSALSELGRDLRKPQCRLGSADVEGKQTPSRESK